MLGTPVYRNGSRRHDAVIRVHDDAGNVIETHEYKGDCKWSALSPPDSTHAHIMSRDCRWESFVDTRSEAGTGLLKSIASTSSWLRELRAVFQLRFPGSTRTMSAAEDLPVGFHSMAEDPTITVRTDWRERMDCTFEAIERVMLARYDDFKCFVVFIFANFAFSHPTNPSRAGPVSAVSGLFIDKRSRPNPDAVIDSFDARTAAECLTRDGAVSFNPFLIAVPRAVRAPNRDAAALLPGAPLFASGNQGHWRD